MAVPRYDEMMVPVLRRIAETPGDTVTSKQLRRFVIDYWGLSDNAGKMYRVAKEGDLPGHPAWGRLAQQWR